MGTNTKVICSKNKIESIANAVRLRENTQDTYTLDDLSTAVENLNNKYVINFTGATPNETVTATKNNVSYSTTSDNNGDGSITVYDYGIWIITDITTSKNRTVIFEKESSIAFIDLPSIYQEIEYIENNATAYIDTGINAKNTLKIECNFMITNTLSSLQEGIYGAMESINGVNTFFVLLLRNPSVARVGTSSNQATSSNYQINTIYNTILQNGKYIENNTEYTFTPSSNFTLTKSIYLFSRNQSSMLSAPAKIYSCKIYENTTILSNLIPCYRKADNVVGMYDTISGEFLTSPNGVAFIAGPDVN